jgi:ATP-dependent RNA helicase DDX24/MAK5
VQAQLSCTPDEKDAFLLLLLRTRLAHGRTILFANAITALQRLKSLLALLEVPALVLLGGMQQRARLKALERFREGGEHASVLLATDVAARGLDIEGVEYVVHYQLPRSAEVYVHRSGRTARAAASGLSIALIEPADHKTYALIAYDCL